MITLDDLKKICPQTKPSVLTPYVEPLNDAMYEFDINNPQREAMFIAQVAHESGGFNYTRELSSGEQYQGRKDLGDIDPGIGAWTKGRGLIEITGVDNYKKASAYFGLDFMFDPEQLEQPDISSRVAAWFWKEHGLNELADKGDFLRITKIINGGTNGYADRQAYLQRAQGVIV